MELLPLLPSVGAITNEIHELEQLKQTLKQFTRACIRGKSYSLKDFNFQSLSRGKGVDLTEKFVHLRYKNNSIAYEELLVPIQIFYIGMHTLKPIHRSFYQITN